MQATVRPNVQSCAFDVRWVGGWLRRRSSRNREAYRGGPSLILLDAPGLHDLLGKSIYLTNLYQMLS